MKVEDLEITTRIYNRLTEQGIINIDQIAMMPGWKMEKIKGMSIKSHLILIKALCIGIKNLELANQANARDAQKDGRP